jgi:hypothetical protein
VLVSVDRVLKRFRTAFIGKVSPVHLFWGSFFVCRLLLKDALAQNVLSTPTQKDAFGSDCFVRHIPISKKMP